MHEFNLTEEDQFERYELVSSISIGEKLVRIILYNSPGCHTLSKSFSMANMEITVTLFLL